MRTLNPRRRRFDERIAAETVRKQVNKALRRLADLGFIDLLDGDRLRLRPALTRFVEPVREHPEPVEALKRLIARGELDVPAAEKPDADEIPDETAAERVDDDEENA